MNRELLKSFKVFLEDWLVVKTQGVFQRNPQSSTNFGVSARVSNTDTIIAIATGHCCQQWPRNTLLNTAHTVVCAVELASALTAATILADAAVTLTVSEMCRVGR